MKWNNSLIIALAISLSLGGISFWLFKDRSTTKHEVKFQSQDQLKQNLGIARSFILRLHPLKALQILKDNEAQAMRDPALHQEWLELTAQAASNLADDQLLETLYQFQPSIFEHKEDLALRIANQALVQGNLLLTQSLYNHWHPISLQPSKWVLLQADSLTLQDQSDLAIKLLLSQTWHGEDEIARLLRLALLNEKEHPRISWDYLTKALKLSPAAGDLHYFRAKLLEDTSHRDLALLEHKEAIQYQPNTPFFKEELIDNYLKHHDWEEAYQAVSHSLSGHSSDALWLKALFLSRMYKPLPFGLNKISVPEGNATPFLRYLLALSPGQIWSDDLLASQDTVLETIERLPEALWIQTVADLKNGNEINVAKRLALHPEMATVYPELYDTLQVVISYKLPHLNFKPVFSNQFLTKNSNKTHPFLSKILEPIHSKDVERLLASQEIYSAIFLSAGWNEAALTLNTMDIVPRDFPKWLPYGLTQAIGSNRGYNEAITFAKRQHPTPQLTLLISHLYLDNGQIDQAIVSLNPIAQNNSEVGGKAAALLSSIYQKRKNYQKAQEVILNNPHYLNTIKGREQLARTSLALGQPLEAEQIYTQILDQSLEAKSYFATKAYQNNDFPRALKLTQELLEKMPHNKELQAQIALIHQALK